MNFCLLCRQEYTPSLSLVQIFSWQKLHQSRLCHHCLKQFEILNGDRCFICSKMGKANICLDCQRWQKFYQGKVLFNYSLYRYNAAFHDLMVSYKRRGDYVLREVLQELCRDYLKKTKYDLYIPVPTSPEHQKKRQFDTISAIYGDIVPLTRLLIKQKGSYAQAEKSKNERLKTPQGFLINPEIEIKENFTTAKVLLLDDIYTTGRTLYHARDCLNDRFSGMQIKSFSICH